MFCPNCAEELKYEDAEICPKCGVRIKEPPSLNQPVHVRQKVNEHPCFVGCGSAYLAIPFTIGAIILACSIFSFTSGSSKDIGGLIFGVVIGLAGIGGAILGWKKFSDTQNY